MTLQLTQKKLYILIVAVFLVTLLPAGVLTYRYFSSDRCPEFSKYQQTYVHPTVHQIASAQSIWALGLIRPVVKEIGQEDGKPYIEGYVLHNSKCRTVRAYFGGDFEAGAKDTYFDGYKKVFYKGEIKDIKDVKADLEQREQISLYYLYKMPESGSITAQMCNDSPMYCTTQNAQLEIGKSAILNGTVDFLSDNRIDIYTPIIDGEGN